MTPAAPGDANLDGKVDINDLTVILTNYGKTTGSDGWMLGDFNGDSEVDVNDLSIVLTNYGQSLGSSMAGTTTAPEPSTIVLLGIGLIGLLGFLRRERLR